MNRWKKWLSNEIGIEFKACLYFYCILLFYCCYQLLQGSFQADIIKMAEMVFTTYIMGNIQVYLFDNFDEAESITVRYALYALFCSILYVGISYVLKWFDGAFLPTLCFTIFIVFCYLCVFLVYKLKRDIDTKQLNADLQAFKMRGESNGKSY